MLVTVIPNVVGALGTVLQDMEKNWKLKEESRQFWLRTAKINQDTYEDLRFQ